MNMSSPSNPAEFGEDRRREKGGTAAAAPDRGSGRDGRGPVPPGEDATRVPVDEATEEDAAVVARRPCQNNK